jgi:hypothetical protein
MLPFLLSAGLWGCTEQPVFVGIGEIMIHVQTANGVKKEALQGERLERAKSCLYSTVEIPKNAAKPEVIQEVILVQVKDRLGDRMFELYTDENFTGNKGKYYRNGCMYRIIKQP